MKIKIKGNLVAFVALLALCVCGMGLLYGGLSISFPYYITITLTSLFAILFSFAIWNGSSIQIIREKSVKK